MGKGQKTPPLAVGMKMAAISGLHQKLLSSPRGTAVGWESGGGSPQGLLHMLAYGFYWLKLTLTGGDGYYDNPFEVEASKAEALGTETSVSADSGSGASEIEPADLTSTSMSS
jgi:hypothetical protein